MKSGQQDQTAERRRAKHRKRKSGALAAHRVFAPMLALWGAALGGLAVMVLPPALVDGFTRGTMVSALGIPAQAALAGAAAVVLGGLLWLIAAAITRTAQSRVRRRTVAELAVRRVRPIDPIRDLGSRSLDEPVETMPFATPAWRDADQPYAEPEPVTQTQPAAMPPAPRALDLSEFAALPGRNGVWVADEPEPEPAVCAPVTQPAAEPITDAAVTRLRPAEDLPDPSAAALARLRAVPPSELSLVQMIERFAGALQEHRASPPARSPNGSDLAAREAALAEALKALAALSNAQQTADADGEKPLRAALARLRQTPEGSGKLKGQGSGRGAA